MRAAGGEPSRVRFRFTAVTRDGEERAGFLTAEDRNSAATQLERRGLTLKNLEELSEAAPVEEASPTTRLSLPQVTLPQIPQVDWRHHLAGLAGLDGRRLGMAVLVVVVALSGLAWGVHRLFGGDKVYRLKLTGECKVQTSRAMAKDYWKRVRPRVWLPKPQWFISSRGTIFAKDKAGKWQVLEQRAKVNYQGSNEGNYTLEIELALAQPPEGAAVEFSARGYSRVRKQVVFKPEGKLYTGQVPSIVLNSRWRRRASGSGTRGVRPRQGSFKR